MVIDNIVQHICNATSSQGGIDHLNEIFNNIIKICFQLNFQKLIQFKSVIMTFLVTINNDLNLE
jgi:hypothetical protein